MESDHPGNGNFDANKFRGVLAGYDQPKAEMSFDLNVNDNSNHPYIHPDDSHFGDQSSSSSSLSPHNMIRDGKQLLSIELQSIEDQLSEQNKVRVYFKFVYLLVFNKKNSQQMPSTSCPNLTQTPDSVHWNQIAQNNPHLNNNNNMPNRNPSYVINTKQQFDHGNGNSNSLFWSSPTSSNAVQSYHNHQRQHPTMIQPTATHATGHHSSMFSTSMSAMPPSNVAENYEYGIDSGMRELKMRFESDLEEHDKQWEQRSSSSNANNQLYASSIRQ